MEEYTAPTDIKQEDTKPLDRWTLVTDKQYRMNTLLKYQLDIMCNTVVYDFDCVLDVDGEIEGSGKSQLAQQVSYYLAWKMGRKFTLDHVVFMPNQFMQAVKDAEKFSVVMWDEAYQGGNKFRMMSTMNQTISTMLQKIRQKNLFIIIVLPYFFDLTTYIAVPRSWFLLHVYLRTQKDIDKDADLDFTKPIFQRGFFEFYSRNKKKSLFFSGRREYNYSTVRGNFIGNFPRFYTIDEAAYREKKLKYANPQEDRLDDIAWVEKCMIRGMPSKIIKQYIDMNDDKLVYIKRKLKLAGELDRKDEDDIEMDNDK